MEENIDLFLGCCFFSKGGKKQHSGCQGLIILGVGTKVLSVQLAGEFRTELRLTPGSLPVALKGSVLDYS